MMNKMWKSIPEFPNYEASDSGEIRKHINDCSWSAGKVLKPSTHSGGYLCVILRKNKKSYCRTVHNLVAQAFFGKRPNGYHINHKNFNKKDNSIQNLEYCTPSENSWHKENNDRGTKGRKNGMCKLSEKDVFNIRLLYNNGLASQYELADKYGVSVATINRTIHRTTWAWLP